jgi:hypothetical protein
VWARDRRFVASGSEIRRTCESVPDARMFLVMPETETTATNTNATGPNGWSIRDEVTQLREWGTNIIYPSIHDDRDDWRPLRDHSSLQVGTRDDVRLPAGSRTAATTSKLFRIYELRHVTCFHACPGVSQRHRARDELLSNINPSCRPCSHEQLNGLCLDQSLRVRGYRLTDVSKFPMQSLFVDVTNDSLS